MGMVVRSGATSSNQTKLNSRIAAGHRPILGGRRPNAPRSGDWRTA